MSTRERVLEYFVYQLKKYTDWPVIQAKQNYAVEFPQCIIVDLMAERSLGDVELWDKEKELVYIAGLRQATLNVQAYGKGSVELLGDLWGFFERPTVVDEFQKANIAVNVPGDVQDLTNVLDNRKYLERASIDLTISYDRCVVDSPEWFEMVYVDAVLKTSDNTKEKTDEKIKIYTDIKFEEGANNG